MAQDPLRELLDLSAVHAFYVSILEARLGHPVPPHDFRSSAPSTLSTTLYHWLNLLDLAVSPVMMRDALQKQPQREALEALLRIYVLRASPTDADRDKTDFLATYLYRNPPGWHDKGRPRNADTDAPEYTTDFEDEIRIILGDVTVAEPPVEHNQLANELDFIHEEVEDLRHFDHLTDSGLVQRVREIKRLLGTSFYHPRILARVAGYNAYFGRCFDELFRQATTHIKNYAEQVQQEGASTMSRVDGDVLVKNLTDVEEEEILRQEYGRAQDNFHKVSKFKKAVDVRRKGRSPAPAAAAATPATEGHAQATAAPPDNAGPLRKVSADIEEGKIRSVLESIQNFMRAMKENAAGMVPLGKVNFGVSLAEAEAYRTDFHGEKSFRAEYALSMRTMVAIAARMQIEAIDYQGKKNSAYLWKPHADALAYLARAADETLSAADKTLATAQQRGLKDKVGAMMSTQQKLRLQMEQTTKLLQRLQ